MAIIVVAVAVGIPIIFLYAVRSLDLYASGGFRPVLFSLLWGLIAFFLSLQVNTFAVPYVGFTLILVLVAPVVEELFKSIILLYYFRHPDFKYFVDESIYGFAAGIGFAVIENLLYLSRVGVAGGLILALSRAFSTSLMHGSASALVGVALGRFRFGKGRSRIASLALGWGAAMTLHIAFNNLVLQRWGDWIIWLAVLLGLSGVALNAVFIWTAIQEDKRVLNDMLQTDVGVSAGEASLVVKQMKNLDQLLEPITFRFGVAKRNQVEAFLRLQTQMGLKRKAQQMTPDPQMRAKLEAEVSAIQVELRQTRRAIGLYCMTYVRSILPSTNEPMWDRLSSLMVEQKPTDAKSLWGKLGAKIRAAEEKVNEAESDSQ